VLVEAMVFVGDGFPFADRLGLAALVEGDEHGECVGGENCCAGVGVGGGDVHADVDAAPAGVDEPCGDFDNVTDDDGPVEADPGDVGADDLGLGPLCAADVGRFVDPAHDAAAVHFAAPADVGRGRQEPQGGMRCGALRGVLYCDSLTWGKILTEVARELTTHGHDLTARAIREFGVETGLVRVAQFDSVRPAHDSFADYLAAAAVHHSVAALPEHLGNHDRARATFLAQLSGVEPAIASLLTRDLPLVAVSTTPTKSDRPMRAGWPKHNSMSIIFCPLMFHTQNLPIGSTVPAAG
jgi:hypothetical protein